MSSHRLEGSGPCRAALHVAGPLFAALCLLTVTSVAAEPLLDVFPDSGLGTLGDPANQSRSVSRVYAPSTSLWKPEHPHQGQTRISESEVALARMEHEQRRPGGARVGSSSFQLRFGQGAQLWSIRGAFGEAIAPQWRPDPPTRDIIAPWMDEVFQIIGMNIRRHDSTKDVDQPGQPTHGHHYMIHQAGVYMQDGLDHPFWSPTPLVRTGPDHVTTLTWAQQARPDTPFVSRMLVYQRARNVGEGIVEMDHVIFNFGPDGLNRFNMPWGGVRLSALGQHRVAEGGTLNHYPGAFNPLFGGCEALNDDDICRMGVEDTDGWAVLSHDAGGNSPSMGIVFGHDRHLAANWQRRGSVWRWGDATTNEAEGIADYDWRNLKVTTLIRTVNVAPGTAFASRYYLVFGTRSRVQSLIENHRLVDRVDYGPRNFNDRTGRVLTWAFDGDNVRRTAPATADFATYARPVRHAVPLFQMRHADGTRYVVTEPDLLAPGRHAHAGQVTIERFLGYGIRDSRRDDTPRPSVSLADVVETHEPSDADTNDNVRVFIP